MHEKNLRKGLVPEKSQLRKGDRVKWAGLTHTVAERRDDHVYLVNIVYGDGKPSPIPLADVEPVGNIDAK